MRKLLPLFYALLLSVNTIAQLVNDETNSLYLDLKNPSNSELEFATIDWEFPSSRYTNSTERRVKFVGSVKSNTKLTSVRLEIAKDEDFKSILGKKTIEIPENALSVKVEETLNLLDGENIIRIVAENETRAKVANSRYVLVGMDAISKAVDINRKDYALLIATDKYDQWSDLVNPIFDSETIAQELEQVYGFQTEILLNPTQDEVLVKLKEYAAKKYRPQDQLFIFVAGHGQYDEGFQEGYLVTKNSLRNDDAKTSYIAHSILRNVVNNIPCEHILLTMDVCFSGTFDPVIARRGDDLYENVETSEMLVRLLSKKTRKYLTSGGKEYVSDGIPGQHSPFARKFLEVLKGRGGADKIITMPEIYATMQGLKTLPRTGSFGDDEKESDFVFVVSE